MTVLILAALAWFSYSMQRKIRVLLKGKPAVRWDQVPRRIGATLKIALGQSKMFKEPGPGIMHALIFWGFLILLVRTISLIGRAYAGDDSNWTLLWFHHGLEGAYTYLKDWTELVVLAMVSWAAWRRAVTRPARLTLSWGGYLVLSLIGGLMVTDFLYDGARFAMANAGQLSEVLTAKLQAEAAWAPIGTTVGGWLAALPAGGLKALEVSMFWLHVVILLFFLNELPLSKHFHVITSIPNVFLSKMDAPGALPPIEDIENQEAFGVNEPRNLTWRQILDGYSCTECGRCTVTCPTVTTGKQLNPKMLICDMRDYIKKHEADILADKDTADSGESLIDHIREEVVWQCTTCRSCEENCPVTITHTDKIVDYRRHLTLMESRYNPEIGLTLKNLENKSNPWGLPMNERGLWLNQEYGVPLLSEKGQAEWLFYMGCSAAYDDRNRKVAIAFVKLLQKAGVDFAILGTEEGCCGDVARRMGNEYLFQIQAQQNIEVFKQYGVKKVVTMCPHGYNAIRNEYPQFGGEFEVVHHSELLALLLSEGRLTIPGGGDALRVVFHDSCYLGRYNDIYDAPRQVLGALPGISLGEIEKSRKNGMCCGAGGGMMFREEHEGERINQVRVKQLQGANPEMIASACPFCLTMNRDGINELDLGEQLKTADIAELLARRMGLLDVVVSDEPETPKEGGDAAQAEVGD
jgi:Fe-S oxidoreductase